MQQWIGNSICFAMCRSIFWSTIPRAPQGSGPIIAWKPEPRAQIFGEIQGVSVLGSVNAREVGRDCLKNECPFSAGEWLNEDIKQRSLVVSRINLIIIAIPSNLVTLDGRVTLDTSYYFILRWKYRKNNSNLKKYICCGDDKLISSVQFSQTCFREICQLLRIKKCRFVWILLKSFMWPSHENLFWLVKLKHLLNLS